MPKHKESVDQWVSRLAKQYSEAELEKLEDKYPKAVRAVRLHQLSERGLKPKEFAQKMLALRKPKPNKEVTPM